MPALSTRGSSSAYGYGLNVYQFVPQLAPGTLGIFVTPINNSPLEQYAFASDVTTTVARLGQLQYYGAIAGTAQHLVIAHGGSAGSALTLKYRFGSTVVATGTNLTQDMSGGSAAGNQTLGIFSIGFYVSVTNRYVWANDACAAGTSLTVAPTFVGAFGNAAFGIFQVGYAADSGTNRYVYASDSVAVDVAFMNSTGVGTGNATTGFMIRSDTGVSQKYDYASGTSNAGTSTSGSVTAGCGNDILAVFVRAASTSVYTYASETFAAGTTVATAAVGSNAGSNGVTGVNI